MENVLLRFIADRNRHMLVRCVIKYENNICADQVNEFYWNLRNQITQFVLMIWYSSVVKLMGRVI